MSKKEKLLSDFLQNPSKLTYKQIENLLLHHNCKKIEAKGSHKKFKHHKWSHDLIIPVHNNNCKDFYKELAKKKLKTIL